MKAGVLLSYLAFMVYISTVKSDGTGKSYKFLRGMLNAIPTDLVEIIPSYKDGYRLIDPNITVPAKNTILSGITITRPYIIDFEINLDGNFTRAMCLFTIAENKINIVLELCFETAIKSNDEPDGIIIRLTSSIFKEHVRFYLFKPDTWTQYSIVVNETSISLYENCNFLDKNDIKIESDLHISPRSIVHLGNSIGQDRHFTGLVSTIDLYSKVSNMKDYICNDYSPLNNNTDEMETEVIIIAGDNDKINDDYINLLANNKEKGEKGEKIEKGDKGKKGEKGQEGVKGDEGKQGMRGDSIKGSKGLQGLKGETGPMGLQGLKSECQCSESVVSNLLKSMDEMKGPPGERGPPGEVRQGNEGKEGPMGPKGEPGPPGKPGKAGEDGHSIRGDPGKDGNPGLPGPAGPRGPPGHAYERTEKEKEVIPGPQGDRGPKGPSGEKGSSGEPGKDGKEGEKGEKGDKGDRGYDGKTGEKGQKGEFGPAGLDGLRGDKGQKGSPGTPAKLSSILDSTTDPDENAAIIEKLTKLGLKGDKGETPEKGTKGDVGPIGPRGPPGVDGKDGSPGERGLQGPVGRNGTDGPRGHKGHKGEPGLPGNVTVPDITLIKGPKGDRGYPGDRGPRGPQGHKGKPGNRGYTGAKGAAGKTGDKGQKGDTPKIEVVKLKAEKGDKGDRGEKGDPGVGGNPGPPGVCIESNYTSHPGPPGPPGPPGMPGTSIQGPKGEPGQVFILDNETETLENEDFFATQTITFRNIKALYKKTLTTPVGTLAFVLDLKILVVRVDQGWQHVPMGSLLDGRELTPKPIANYPTTTEQTTQTSYLGQKEKSMGSLPEGKELTPKPIVNYAATTEQTTQISYARQKDKSTDLPVDGKVEEASQIDPPVDEKAEPSSQISPAVHDKVLGPLVDDRIASFTPFTGCRKTLQPTQETSAYLREGKYIRLAALNEPYAGNMMNDLNQTGRSVADNMCYLQAQRFRVKGNFVAFLANNIEDLRSIVKTDKDIPVVNINHHVIFNSWSDIFDGNEGPMTGGLIYSFDRRHILIDRKWPIKAIWHGSDILGKRLSNVTCDDWYDGSSSSYGAASSLTACKLLAQEKFRCDTKLIVLCVEFLPAPQDSYSPRKHQRHSRSRKRQNRQT